MIPALIPEGFWRDPEQQPLFFAVEAEGRKYYWLWDQALQEYKFTWEVV